MPEGYRMAPNLGVMSKVLNEYGRGMMYHEIG